MLIVEMHPQCWPAVGVTESMVRDTLRDLRLVASPLAAGEPLFGLDTHTILMPEVRAH